MATSPAPVTLTSKFDTLDATLNHELVERRPEIRAAILTLIAASTYFMLGEPGTAKSLLPARLMAYISDAVHFDILMTRFTEPPEVFGPQSLVGLKQDKFVRKIEGYLPTAHTAMIDEIFKANSSILNAFLWAINERKYRHDTSIIEIPLSALFCASNELPQDESLNALYDRLLTRMVVTRVRDQRNFGRMLRTTIEPNPTPILTWAEVEQAQNEAKQVTIPTAVIDAMTELRKELFSLGIEPSERRFVQSLKLVRAAAWLEECDTADVEHLRPLEHVLWMKKEQQPKVSEIVLALSNPLENDAKKLLAGIKTLETQLDNIKSDDEKQAVGNEINGKLRRAKEDLDGLRGRAGGSNKRSVVLDDVQEKLTNMTDRVLVEIFGFSPEEAANISKG